MIAPSHILVAEDDLQIRQLNYLVLTRAGYQADLAEDGQVAWDLVRKNNYDLLVTDNSMPRMKGFELVRKMQAAGISVPVVLAAAPLTREDEVEFQGLKIDGRVVKPFRMEELVGVVRSVLASHLPRQDSHMWHAA